jgi:hypothetical protein
MGVWRYSSITLDLSMEVCDKLQAQATSPPPHPLTELQQYSFEHKVGLDAVEKRNLLPLPGTEPQPSSPLPITILTELSQFLEENTVG